MNGNLEDLVEGTLSAHAADAPDADRLLADVNFRATRRRHGIQLGAVGLTAAVTLAIVVTLFVVLPTGKPGSAPAREPIAVASKSTYPLPSDGWKPGDPSLYARTAGPFHAARRNGQICAWLGDTFRPMLWPAAYSVRLNPVELISPYGTIVAREGQNLGAAGGIGNAKPDTPCSQPGQSTWYINGSLGATGILHGRLLAAGGPSIALPRPLPGTVTVTGPHGQQSVTVGKDGTYSLAAPPGSYTITGHSPRYGDNTATCKTTAKTVRLTTGKTQTRDVLCQEN
jgi:hypothetical protein